MIDIAIVACLMLSQSSEEAQTFDTKLDFYYFNQFESSVTTGGNVEVSSSGTSLRLDSQVTNDDNLLFDFPL